MLWELRIEKTQAVEAQPRASVIVTFACSCSLSSSPPYFLGLRMRKRPASCSRRKVSASIRLDSSAWAARWRSSGTRSSAARRMSSAVRAGSGAGRVSSRGSIAVGVCLSIPPTVTALD